jgi:hypothetical protein
MLLGMNRKRLALTAAVVGAIIGAIANPVLTGRSPACYRVANMEFILQQNQIARDADFKARRAAVPPASSLLPLAQMPVGGILSVEGQDGPPLQGRVPTTVPESDPFDNRARITDCSYLIGLLVSVLLGAAALAALTYFGPRLLAVLTAWLRWVSEPDR